MARDDLLPGAKARRVLKYLIGASARLFNGEMRRAATVNLSLREVGQETQIRGGATRSESVATLRVKPWSTDDTRERSSDQIGLFARLQRRRSNA